MSNFAYLIAEAICKDQSTMGLAEVTQAKTTEFDITLQTNAMTHWNQVLDADATAVKNAHGDAARQAAQTRYNADSANTQSNQSAMDTTTQAAQTQAGTIGSDLQMKAQIVQTVSSVLTTLSNLLGRLLG